jgi:hypothetical protein
MATRKRLCILNAHAVVALLSTAFLVFSGADLVGQTAQTVSDRVRDAMVLQQPAWHLDWSKAEPITFRQRWTHGEERIDISYDEMASEAEAIAWFNNLPVTISAGGGVIISGVGDQARILWGLSLDGSATIHFRKGKSAVSVTAPGQILTKEIAQLVAAQIY